MDNTPISKNWDKTPEGNTFAINTTDSTPSPNEESLKKSRRLVDLLQKKAKLLIDNTHWEKDSFGKWNFIISTPLARADSSRTTRVVRSYSKKANATDLLIMLTSEKLNRPEKKQNKK
jgi:hypothetical protein